MRPEERHAIKDIRECENENQKSHFSNMKIYFNAIKEITLHLLRKNSLS